MRALVPLYKVVGMLVDTFHVLRVLTSTNGSPLRETTGVQISYLAHQVYPSKSHISSE
jgi:hypothetical protein